MAPQENQWRVQNERHEFSSNVQVETCTLLYKGRLSHQNINILSRFDADVVSRGMTMDQSGPTDQLTDHSPESLLLAEQQPTLT